MHLATLYRPLALVTGASSGIGRGLARELALRGFDLVVAADDEALEDARRELEATGAAVDAVQVDLSVRAGVERLAAHVRSRDVPVTVAALNAGIATGGRFASDSPLERELDLVDLNVRSTVHLAKHLATDMAERGSGRLLFTSSIAADSPGPYQAVYNASKAFIQSFSLALREELRGTGVTVTSLMPGPAATPIYARGGLEDTLVGRAPKDDPAQIAADGVAALLDGRERVVSSSLVTKLTHRLSRLLPDAVKARGHAVMTKPRPGLGRRRA
jgi:short-subunit dehydrogenase